MSSNCFCVVTPITVANNATKKTETQLIFSDAELNLCQTYNRQTYMRIIQRMVGPLNLHSTEPTAITESIPLFIHLFSDSEKTASGASLQPRKKHHATSNELLLGFRNILIDGRLDFLLAYLPSQAGCKIQGSRIRHGDQSKCTCKIIVRSLFPLLSKTLDKSSGHINTAPSNAPRKEKEEGTTATGWSEMLTTGSRPRNWRKDIGSGGQGKRQWV
jgi:hypothetical protein